SCPFRQIPGTETGGPAAETAARTEAAEAHAAAVTGADVDLIGLLIPLFLCQLQLARFAARVDEQKGMVDDAWIARTHFDGNDGLVLREVRRKRKPAKDVAPARPQLKLAIHRQHQVRRPELPAFRELARRRGILWIALRRVLVHPGGECLDFLVA